MKLLKVLITLIIIGAVNANPLTSVEKKVETKTREEWKEAWAKLATLEHKFRDDGAGCQCIKYNCGCCVDLNIPKLHIDLTKACVNASYLPDQYGISLTFSLGNKVYINETISAKNPPPICVGIPHFEKDASICIDFYDLDYSKSSFSGCIKLEARLIHLVVENVELGCFKFPLATSRPMVLLQKAKRIQMVEKMYVDKKLGMY